MQAPDLLECVYCYPDMMELDLPDLCATNATVSMTDNMCDIVETTIDGATLAYSSSPVNIFKPNSDLIDCAVVKANAGKTATFTYGWKTGVTVPTTCRLPDPVEFVIPDLSA